MFPLLAPSLSLSSWEERQERRSTTTSREALGTRHRRHSESLVELGAAEKDLGCTETVSAAIYVGLTSDSGTHPASIDLSCTETRCAAI